MTSRFKAGARLREMRGDRTMTEICGKLGISQSALSMYELDQRVPVKAKMKQIADFYGVSVGWLFFGEDIKPTTHGGGPMTICEVENLETEVLTPAQVASVLHTDPTAIRLAARRFPEKLGFPVICIGSRVKVPRMAFLKWLKGEGG